MLAANITLKIYPVITYGNRNICRSVKVKKTPGPDLTSAVNRFHRKYGSSQSHQMPLFRNHGTLSTYDTACPKYLECRGFEITAFGEIANCRTYGEIYLRTGKIRPRSAQGELESYYSEFCNTFLVL